MKFIVLLGDGMADEPIAELGGKTPLAYAETPNMDRLAREGTVGLIDTIAAGFSPGSDVANLAVLGYDPRLCYTGRGPLEAANMGIPLAAEDVAFRCNLLTLSEQAPVRMEDFTAGHITSAEAHDLISDLQEKLGNQAYRFYPGVGYRHLLVWKGGNPDIVTTPPHDIIGRPVDGFQPTGVGAEALIDLMDQTRRRLFAHPVNNRRREAGKRPANAAWLWGQGRAPRIAPLTRAYGITGGMISAVDLLNGIGVYAGLRVIRVPGATGYTDTNYAGKAEYALEALRTMDFVFVHVEAIDEMGHEGNLRGKIQTIEAFDEKVVGTIVRGLPALGDVRVLILSDHPTPIRIKTHSADPSPFVAWSSVRGENRSTGLAYSEATARAGGLLVSPGHGLMRHFLSDWRGFLEAGGQAADRGN